MKLAIYNLLILLLIPVFQFRILLKSFSDKGYRTNLSQRYGKNLSSINCEKKKIIWFHAVSLGEVIGSQNIIQLLLKSHDVLTNLHRLFTFPIKLVPPQAANQKIGVQTNTSKRITNFMGHARRHFPQSL